MAVSSRVAALCGAAGVAFVALSGTALADKLSWSATLTGTSDYVFRGISQTENHPTIQGAIDFSYGAFYVGTWASGLDFEAAGLDDDIEIDYYGGIKHTWSNVEVDLGFIYYNYPGDSVDLFELKGGASTTIDKISIGGIAYYNPDYNAEYAVYEGSLGYDLGTFKDFSLSVGGLVGYFDFLDGAAEDYTYWNAGLGVGVGNISLDFRYWDTDASDADCFGVLPSTCDERFVFSASVSVP